MSRWLLFKRQILAIDVRFVGFWGLGLGLSSLVEVDPWWRSEFRFYMFHFQTGGQIFCGGSSLISMIVKKSNTG